MRGRHRLIVLLCAACCAGYSGAGNGAPVVSRPAAPDGAKAQAAQGAQGAQPVQPVALLAGQSSIGFVSHEMGVPVHGSFGHFTADVRIDTRHPEASRFAIAVDLTSVQLPTDDGTTEAAKPDWLDTAQHPVARFTSSAVHAEGNGRYTIDGRLAIKGVVRTVTVPVALTQSGNGPDRVTVASGDLAIRRLDYGIGIGDWVDTSVVADPVEIDFRLALKGVAAVQ